MGTSEHLSAGQLAGYLHQDLGPDERLAVEEHLDRCVECRADLIDLVRSAAPETTSVVGGLRRTARWWIPAVAAAGLAALLLLRPGEPPGVPPAGVERPGVGASESMPRITVVAPADGAAASRQDLVFTWRARAADTYRLTLLTQTGERVWTVDTSDTVAVLPPGLALTPGVSYFWRVEAMADGISATSDAQRFELLP